MINDFVLLRPPESCCVPTKAIASPLTIGQGSRHVMSFTLVTAGGAGVVGTTCSTMCVAVRFIRTASAVAASPTRAVASAAIGVCPVVAVACFDGRETGVESCESGRDGRDLLLYDAIADHQVGHFFSVVGV